MTADDWTPPPVPQIRREAAGRYWIDNYEIVNTGRHRWTLTRIDPDHVRTCGGGRDDGSSIVDNHRTLAEAVADAIECWTNERHPLTIAKTREANAPVPTRTTFPPAPRR